MNTRFARFINMPELLSIFRTLADIQTGDMLQLPRPEFETDRPIIEAAQASDTLESYIQTLVKRIEALKKERIPHNHRSSSTPPDGVEQQINTFPATGGSSGSG